MRPATPQWGESFEFAVAERRGLPFWVATPVRLARFPGVLLAVVGATLILAVAAAAGPLFLSSARTAALQESLASAAGAPALSVVQFGPISNAFIGPPDQALRAAVRGLPPVGSPLLSLTADMTASKEEGGEPAAVKLVFRTGFQEHVQSEGVGPGVWLTPAAAASLGVGPADRIRFKSGLTSTTTPVAGTYQPLEDRSLSGYWRPLRDLFMSPKAEPAPVILADQGTLTAIGDAVHGTGRMEWDFPLAANRLSLPQAESLSAQLSLIQQQVADPKTSLGASFQTEKFGTSAPFAESPLPALTRGAQEIAGAIEGPVQTISVAGRVLALLGVAAAGAYAVRRRRVEASLMSARGAGPAVQGALATMEAMLPGVLGAAIGWLLAVILVRVFGPSSFVQADVQRSSLITTASVLGVSLLFLGGAAAMASRLEFEEIGGRLPGAVARAPWEAAVLVLAAAAFYEITVRGSGLVASGLAPHLDRLLLLFPLLFVAGAAGLAVRGLSRALRRVRGAGASLWTPFYLAFRRVASAPRIALLLVTASSLAIGILAYAAMVSDSVAITAREKALVAVGSDVAVPVPGPTVPSGLEFPATVVARIEGSVVPGGRAVDVLAVDPDGFGAAAFWDPRFSGTSLADLLRGLPGAGVRVPVVLVGAEPSPHLTLRLPEATAALRVVGTARAFPGMRPARAMAVADAGVLYRAVPSARGLAGRSFTLWANGDPSVVLAALREAGIDTGHALTAERLERTPAVLAVTWTFRFLQALGIVAGLVVLVGLVLYLQARQEGRNVSYALSRRMGLSPRAHGWSVGFELVGMLLTAFVLGAALAAMAARIVYRKLDVLPEQPPAPLYRLPLPVFGAIAVALVVVAAVGAMAVQRRAGRANVAEVMRVAR